MSDEKIRAQVMSRQQPPLYQHDCARCIYLGRYLDKPTNRWRDLYVCKSSGTTVIARYGNEGSEYVSGLAFVGITPALTEAFNRAYTKGLLKIVGNF